MAHFQTPRPAPQAKQSPLTEEEKKAKIMEFLQQKRETFAVNILCQLCAGVSSARAVVEANLHSTTIVIDTTGLVDDAVKMADELLDKLYPLPKEEKAAEEKPVEKERERLKGNLKEEVCASDVCAYRGKNVCTIKRDEYCPMFKAKEEGEK